MDSTTSSPPLPAQSKKRWLRVAMLSDAAVTGANGIAYIAAVTLLTTLLGPPAPFLLGIGAFLACYACVILLVGSARSLPPAGVWFAIVMNTAWSIASILYVITIDWLTSVGTVWAVFQAFVVLGFAVAQAIGLRWTSIGEPAPRSEQVGSSHNENTEGREVASNAPSRKTTIR